MKISEIKQYFFPKEKFLLVVSGFLFLLLISESSFAVVFLDSVGKQFKAGAEAWEKPITDIAKNLFWKLVLIDFSWTTIVWVKDRRLKGSNLKSEI